MTPRLKIIIDDKIPYTPDFASLNIDAKRIGGAKITQEDLRDADALMVRTRTKVNAQILDKTKVDFVATATIGFDHIDRQYLADNNVEWTNCPGCNSESVAQYFCSALFNLADKYNWNLKEKTLGVVGIGNVGSKVVRKAQALGMKVVQCDPPRKEAEGIAEFVDLATVKAEADFITFHVPYTKEGEYKTHHLVDESFLKTMKSDAALMNSSRGDIIDNIALREAMKENAEIKAVLDVWEKEPNIDSELLALVDVATSHIAGYSADGKAKGTSMSLQAISRHFKLDLDDWFPDNVPVHESMEINIDNATLSDLEVAREACLTTYDTSTDDKLIRSDISSFEYNRGNYQLRREFHNYTVKLSTKNDSHEKVIKGLGFQLAE